MAPTVNFEINKRELTDEYRTIWCAEVVKQRALSKTKLRFIVTPEIREMQFRDLKEQCMDIANRGILIPARLDDKSRDIIVEYIIISASHWARFPFIKNETFLKLLEFSNRMRKQSELAKVPSVLRQMSAQR